MPSLLDALIQTESNGNPSARGPMTKYGQALGSTQMLPATAEEMARKLGIPFRADLLTSPTEEGKAYQRQLGEAYLQEGFDRTGNARDALRYYHGGPNRQLWGPKTNAYADKVLSLSGDSQPMMPQQNIPPVFDGGMSDDPLSVLSQGSLADIIRMDPAILNTPQIEPGKPGVFGRGGIGTNLLGYIGDAISRHYGGQATFGPAMAAQQQDERDNQRRLAEYRERIAAQREERMNQPYRFQNNAGDVVELVPSSGDTRVLYADPVAKPEWARTEGADGSISLNPVPNTSRPSRQHVEALLANPDRAAEFDAKFGRGMAAYILRGR